MRTRVVVAETSNSAPAAAALRHRYAELRAAGVEVWELPGTVVHAKIVVADDVVSFGTVNLDAWALYRNSEIMMIARSPEVAALMRERLFEPDVARSRPGRSPSATARAARQAGCGTSSRTTCDGQASAISAPSDGDRVGPAHHPEPVEQPEQAGEDRDEQRDLQRAAAARRC